MLLQIDPIVFPPLPITGNSQARTEEQRNRWIKEIMGAVTEVTIPLSYYFCVCHLLPQLDLVTPLCDVSEV